MLTLGGVACGNADEWAPPEPAAIEVSPFALATTSIHLEIDYVEGAEPFAGALGSLNDIWDITRANVSALFPGKALLMPANPSEMERIATPGNEAYSSEDILRLAREHWDREVSPTTARYYFLWVDGWFEKGGELRRRTAGVAISDQHVMAVFKPAILALEPSGPTALTGFVEQSALVHELGHAIGLVDRGLPLESPHADPEHPLHCANSDCVMYYLNEGVWDLRDFVLNAFNMGPAVLFDDACLTDVAAALE